MKHPATTRSRVIGTLAILATAFAFAACTPDSESPDDGTSPDDNRTDDSEPGVDQAAIDAALAAGGTLEFWAWAVQYEPLAEAFQLEFPNVTIEYLNPGSASEQNIRVQNAISAGSGIPDVIQLEAKTLTQWVLADAIIPLGEYDLNLSEVFTPAAISATTVNDEQYGFAMDGGAMIMWYRADIFEDHGVEVPTTWEEYEAAARALRAADPNLYMTPDSGTDSQFIEGILQALGSRPFVVDGTTVTIDLSEQSTQQWAELWTRLVADDLIDVDSPTFGPDWTQGLAEGKYATWISGAWGVGSLTNRIPEGEGLWRAAPLPRWDPSVPLNGVQGGSAVALPSGSDNHLLAVGFAQWISSSPIAQELYVELNGIPVTQRVQASPEWLDVELPFYGGQQVNQVIAEAFETVNPDWDYLPFSAFAGSVFPDHVGTAYAEKTSIGDALIAWGEALKAYGESQGFTIG